MNYKLQCENNFKNNSQKNILIEKLVLSLPKIKTMQEKSNIPNKEGFEFIAILSDGSQVKTKVCKNEKGLHSFKEFKNTIGWLKIKNQ